MTADVSLRQRQAVFPVALGTFTGRQGGTLEGRSAKKKRKPGNWPNHGGRTSPNTGLKRAGKSRSWSSNPGTPRRDGYTVTSDRLPTTIKAAAAR